MTEAETYFCIKTMIETSKTMLDENNENGEVGVKAMRWYITLESDDFVKMCGSFFDIVQEKSFYFNEILEFFKKHNCLYIDLFQEWIKDLFQEVFPLSVNRFFLICFFNKIVFLKLVLKIFTSYLNEGVKIYFRASYGILYMLKVIFLLIL